LVSKSNNIGERVGIGCEDKRNSYGEWEAFSDSPTEQNAMAWTESALEQEIRFLTKYLIEQNWIEVEFNGRCSYCTVLVNGYRHIADRNTNPSTAQALATDMEDKQVREHGYDFFIGELQRIVDGMTGKPKAHPSRFCTGFRGRSRTLFRASGVAS
jgi:hypothetical protein